MAAKKPDGIEQAMLWWLGDAPPSVLNDPFSAVRYYVRKYSDRPDVAVISTLNEGELEFPSDVEVLYSADVARNYCWLGKRS